MNCWFLSLFIVFLIYFILSVDAVIDNMLINKILVDVFLDSRACEANFANKEVLFWIELEGNSRDLNELSICYVVEMALHQKGSKIHICDWLRE